MGRGECKGGMKRERDVKQCWKYDKKGTEERCLFAQLQFAVGCYRGEEAPSKGDVLCSTSLSQLHHGCPGPPQQEGFLQPPCLISLASSRTSCFWKLTASMFI